MKGDAFQRGLLLTINLNIFENYIRFNLFVGEENELYKIDKR
jgi:hypothetical protein